MESTLTSAPVEIAPLPIAPEQIQREADLLSALRRVIEGDCQIAPAIYLEEVRVAVGGE